MCICSNVLSVVVTRAVRVKKYAEKKYRSTVYCGNVVHTMNNSTKGYEMSEKKLKISSKKCVCKYRPIFFGTNPLSVRHAPSVTSVQYYCYYQTSLFYLYISKCIWFFSTISTTLFRPEVRYFHCQYTIRVSR